jgi:hypothetical protein
METGKHGRIPTSDRPSEISTSELKRTKSERRPADSEVCRLELKRISLRFQSRKQSQRVLAIDGAQLALAESSIVDQTLADSRR